ncbi:MAG: undecaprenyl/decaprenyl-phosphate alpha-N-acetylglucosaminyl 1-phosphate transferase [Ruminococcaceae bacterium]|nr:undecaprenyl/decaprenyl-phosphate alpha-N-acetylglucosaminyl 1-phosphate transferase [Oscillospiraceae bacterium]
MTLETYSHVLITLGVAVLASFLFTPVVKAFANKVGAVDIPKDDRRMHKEPVPLLGGLAIFLSFMLAVLLFAEIDRQIKGMLLGAVIIVLLGVIDDIRPLNAIFKFAVQILAAVVAVAHGNVIQFLSNPIFFGESLYFNLGFLAVPVTVVWIVAITNAVNLIDGLDGLSVGVSAINSASLLVISLLVSDVNVAIMVAALLGACLGFMPYNINPAKIFMGDTGATFLGYILAVLSIQGLFKFYTIISFLVPFLILGVPIFDTVTAFFRRIIKGQAPWKADRSHIHHKLIDMGYSQKQSVAILYLVTAILGLSAVMLTTEGWVKFLILAIDVVLVIFITRWIHEKSHHHEKENEE